MKMHVNTICMIEYWEIACWESRHPKICRYFYERKYYKLGDHCKYLHKNDENQTILNEFMEKIKLLEDNMKTKEAKITSLENHLGNLEENVINLNDKIFYIEKEKDKPIENKSTKLCDNTFPCDRCEKVYKSKCGLT